MSRFILSVVIIVLISVVACYANSPRRIKLTNKTPSSVFSIDSQKKYRRKPSLGSFRPSVRIPTLKQAPDLDAEHSITYRKVVPANTVVKSVNKTAPKLVKDEEGWLSRPTASPRKINKPHKSNEDEKKGHCGTSKGYGIKCMMRLDQCKKDEHCPGATKCCEVGECGRLCVKPKVKATKKETLPPPQDLETLSSERIEVSTTAEGLKIEDMMIHP